MIIWLASYPKSGNTWLRSIISSLIYSNDGNFNFEHIYKIRQFPNREYFEPFTKNYQDIHELKKYWIPAQDLITLKNKVEFLKTHHINCKIDNYNFTNGDNTLATIYIVRDPRNLIKSFTNHYSMDASKATQFLIRPQPAFASGHVDKENTNHNIFTLIGCWKDHYVSWTRNNNKLLLIKYEDMLNDINKEILRIVDFIKEFVKIDLTDEKLKNIIKSTSFQNLKNLEKKHEFKEASTDKKDKNKKKDFFYLGKENKWEKYLDEENRIKIENELKDLMKELNYL